MDIRGSLFMDVIAGGAGRRSIPILYRCLSFMRVVDAEDLGNCLLGFCLSCVVGILLYYYCFCFASLGDIEEVIWWDSFGPF